MSAEDSRARLADLPPIDSHSLVPILMGKTTISPRTELAIGMPTTGGPERGGGYVGGLIQYPWKLLVGDVPMAGWTGPAYPNHTTDTNCFTSVSANPSKIPLPCAPECLCIARCGLTGCLFNIEDDETEHYDIAASNQAIARRMLARIVQVSTAFLGDINGRTVIYCNYACPACHNCFSDALHHATVCS